MTAPKYKVIWDNGANASGTFPTTFGSEEEAETFGNNWRREMCLIDGIDPDDEDIAETYTFDVIEDDEPSEGEDEDHEAAEEQSLDYFNRYIAGDR